MLEMLCDICFEWTWYFVLSRFIVTTWLNYLSGKKSFEQGLLTSLFIFSSRSNLDVINVNVFINDRCLETLAKVSAPVCPS